MEMHIQGARENNLKNIDLRLQKGSLIVLTGCSGSGKSSLAVNTVFASAQREFLDTLSLHARRFMQKLKRPDVDMITGLSPAVLVDQKGTVTRSNATVATASTAYMHLRQIFSLAGTPHLPPQYFSFHNELGACFQCKGSGTKMALLQEALFDISLSLNDGAIRHRSFKVDGRYWNILKETGFFDMDRPLQEFTGEEMDKLLDSPAIVFKKSAKGIKQQFTFEGIRTKILKRHTPGEMAKTHVVHDQDTPFIVSAPCDLCDGTRLNTRALDVRILDVGIQDFLHMPIEALPGVMASLKDVRLGGAYAYLLNIIDNLIALGLGYLTLARAMNTVSGGEGQRIKLARLLSSSLSKLIYIVDEPTSSLHANDRERLHSILKGLRDKGNTVIVIEHDETMIRNADYVVEFGPGSGAAGGEIVCQGPPSELVAKERSLTGALLRGEFALPASGGDLRWNDVATIRNARLNNLQGFDVEIPSGGIVCIAGVSGSGKSSLAQEILRQLPHSQYIDQSSVKNSSSSTLATYIGIFDEICQEFGGATSMPPGYFKPHGKGACATCRGLGFVPMEMMFLDTARLQCEECQGQRYTREALSFRYKGVNITELLELTVSESANLLEGKKIRNKLKTLVDMNLSYLTLDRHMETLSGGESQRLKLCRHLKGKQGTLVLDEPTRGLHPRDMGFVFDVLRKLTQKHARVVVTEHNLKFLARADWIIELGPGSGDRGGRIIAQGTPASLKTRSESIVGEHLVIA
jgi:excinuclease ABC A subunit